MNSDSRWISIGNMKPTTDCKVRAVLALVEGNYRIYHVWPGDSNFPGMTHWQPLPQLPPIRDAFEVWWEKWRKWECDRDVIRWRDYTIGKESARWVWDAAINTQNK